MHKKYKHTLRWSVEAHTIMKLAPRPEGGNIICMDIGVINTAYAVFDPDKNLNGFGVFSASSAACLIRELNTLAATWNPIHVYIERQMRVNIAATRVSHWIEMFWHINLIKVDFVASKNKYTNHLDVPSTKYQRKKWAVTIVLPHIPAHLMSKYLSYPKRDDIADCILIHLYVCTLPRNERRTTDRSKQ